MAISTQVLLEGQALNSFGFTAYNTISGLGLNTFGFLWPDSEIWNPWVTEDSVTTTWTECSGGC